MLPKDMYKKMLKEHIKPIFKEKGFKTKGNAFVKENKDIVQIIHLVPHRWNVKEENSFTIDFFITSKQYIDLLWNNQFKINFFSYNTYPSLIEGSLQNFKKTWAYPGYTIKENTDLKILAEEVILDLNHIVIPYLEKYNSFSPIIEDMDISRRNIGSISKIFLYHLLNQNENAQTELNKCLELWDQDRDFKSRLLDYANRLGLKIPKK